MTAFSNRALMTDFYELTMAQGYYNEGRANETATFELFYRSNPFKGGYTVVAGMAEAIDFVKSYAFTENDIKYLREQEMFTEDFLEYLSTVKFEGEITGLPEGSVAFPYLPLLQITGPIIILQLLESALLNIINYSTLIATKASRVVNSTGKFDTVLEFGLRRAQGDGAMSGARAAIIGGCIGTSNTLAGKIYNLPVSGTQAHSWIQSFDSELEAFRAYARTFPNNTILLVDTYDTLKSGIPNAIKVAKEMEKRGQKLQGIRLDSGDLAWLAIKSAEMLDDAGLEDVKIVLSSDLDEYVVESIVNQIIGKSERLNHKEFRNRLLDRLLWGVGTNLITGSGDDQAALGGVYKLVQIRGEPVIKISENRSKTTNPGKKQVWRLKKPDGSWIADLIGTEDEAPPQQGDRIYHPSDPTKSIVLNKFEFEELHVDLLSYYSEDYTKEQYWKEAKERCKKQVFKEIDKSHLRFLNPHIYRISLTEKLFNRKQQYLKKH